MKILFVWDGDYPWDIRVAKICASLHRDGHQVDLVCRNLARKPLSDQYQATEIHRLPFLPVWLGKFNDAISFPAFFSPLWLWRMYSVAKKQGSEIIIVRDLPMAIGAIWVARRLGILCILDMAECYPEMLRCMWQFEGRNFRNYFLRNPWLADKVEQNVMRNIDQIWVMIEESRDRLVNMGVETDKIHMVSNTPVIDRFAVKKDNNEASEEPTLIYLGLLNPSRGVDTAIRAAVKFYETNPNFRFRIVGKGKAEKQLKDLVAQLGGGDFISFLGWVDNDEALKLLAESDIGIVPHHRCSHWDNTIPNKLFDYMAASKPVIVSDVVPLQRIINETQCGLSYTDYNVDELVYVLTKMSDIKVRQKMAENGRRAIEGKYNWDREEKVLLSSLAELD